MLKYISSFIVLILTIFIISCSGTGSSSDKSSTDKATIKLNIAAQSTQTTSVVKDLAPDLDMAISSYTICCTGPGGAAYTGDTSDNETEIYVTAFGTWTIQVDAKNQGGIILQRGSNTANVNFGEVTSVNIALNEVDGWGTLDITVNWSADIQGLSIDAKLLPETGAPITFPFQFSDKTAIGAARGIPSGYYTFILKLIKGSVAVAPGIVDVVRIVNNEFTTGTYNFNDLNLETPIIVEVTPEENDPLVVSLTGQLPGMDVGGSITVTASVAGNPGDVTYNWYLNGDPKATGSSYTVSGLQTGSYNLTATAFTTDHKRAGSASHSLKVIKPKTVYTGGYYFPGKTFSVNGVPMEAMTACYWKGNAKIDLPVNESYLPSHPELKCNARVTSIFVYQGKVYCSGAFFTSADGSSACYWDGTTKINLESAGQSNFANSICYYNGAIYCGGYTASGPCYWSDLSLKYLPIKTTLGGSVASICVFNGTVYSGGHTTTTTNIPHLYGACYWTGDQRIDLSDHGNINSIYVYKNSVYTGGSNYNSVTGATSPCYWTDTTRVDLPGAAPYNSGWVTSIFVYNGEVYSVGHYYNKNGRRIPCYWTGTIKTDLTDESYIAVVNSIIVSDNKIYIGGNTSTGSIDHPCFWTISATGIIRTDLLDDSIRIAVGSSIFVE